jgi:predicted nucleic acid-binding protein
LIVVDTSVVVKWAIDEDGAEAARRLIGGDLLAPDLVIFELGNVLTKKIRNHELDRKSATTAHAELPLLLRITPSRPHAKRAFDLALQLHHSIYDCYFLALAEAAQLELITADDVFVRKLRHTNAGFLARLLSEYRE